MSYLEIILIGYIVNFIIVIIITTIITTNIKNKVNLEKRLKEKEVLQKELNKKNMFNIRNVVPLFPFALLLESFFFITKMNSWLEVNPDKDSLDYIIEDLKYNINNLK